MNILLWILQVLLAVHTVIGAIWKFSNSEQAVPSLSAIPHEAWLGLGVIEILCALGLVLPVIKSLAGLAPLSAAIITAEMLLFCGLHLISGVGESGQLVYWLVVAAVAAFVAYGRAELRPH